ncbi:MAG TPA: hypothetical protein VGO07_05570, partial [Candidatus Saccharimonadales bacterium]|nr:hypothetical protein [Candidatus Saccharimonadales bacterium]
ATGQELLTGIPQLADPEQVLVGPDPSLERGTATTAETTAVVDQDARLVCDSVYALLRSTVVVRAVQKRVERTRHQSAVRGSIAVATAHADRAMRDGGWGRT